MCAYSAVVVSFGLSASSVADAGADAVAIAVAAEPPHQECLRLVPFLCSPLELYWYGLYACICGWIGIPNVGVDRLT